MAQAEIHSPRSQPSPLKPNWFHILLALAERSRHGYGIMKEVERQTGGVVRIWSANLYGAIKDLCDGGFVEEALHGPDDDDADDPRRRYYRITSQGQSVLAIEVDRLEDLVALARGRKVEPCGEKT